MKQNPCPIPLPDFSRELLAWYDAGHRDLPWRENPTPYRVWISEIMLQQTRAEAVKPYFARFLSALPDVPSLAACPPDALNKLWEGLGYYSRAANLQKAAGILTRDYQGALPRDYRALLSLPGIGTYTAGAIAAIAYGLPEPAVDGNVLRVLARLTGDSRNILLPAVKRDYEDAIRAVIPTDRPGDYDQALIELGATLCGPNTAPDCSACPLRTHCAAHRSGRETELPVREKPKPKKHCRYTVLVITDGSHILLHRRDPAGLLAGLYEFPMANGWLDTEGAVREAQALGLVTDAIRHGNDGNHVFTHLVWEMQSYVVTIPAGALPADVPLALGFPHDDGASDAVSAPRTLGDEQPQAQPPIFPRRVLMPDPAGTYVFASPAGLADRYAIPSAHDAFQPFGATVG